MSSPPAPPSATVGSRSPRRSFGTATATLLVIASMVGTGIFTTTGFLLRDLSSPGAVLLAWAIGGLVATCGALSYAELTTRFPNNGGEYQLLSRVYHPRLGFVAGWASLLVGFSAPTAAAALACGEYARGVFPHLDPLLVAVSLLGISAALHALRLGWGERVQNALTVLQVVLIVTFVGLGSWQVPDFSLAAPSQPAWWQATLSPSFAVSLVYVAYSYSGWNAAAYVAGELEQPARTLPRALVLGTLAVTLLYLALTYVLLLSPEPAELSGRVDVARVAAEQLGGSAAGRAVSALVALGLITSVGALLITGARVYEAMGRDYPRLSRWMAPDRRGKQGPAVAILLQTVVALALLVSSSFDALLSYVGFLLSVFSGLAIYGVFVVRSRDAKRKRGNGSGSGNGNGNGQTYRAWGHPLSSLLALGLTAWMLGHTIYERPGVSIAGAATLTTGLGLYAWASHSGRGRRKQRPLRSHD